MARVLNMAFNEPSSSDSSPHATPLVKDNEVPSCSYDTFSVPSTSSQCSIIMDEFGQTPDHYYLAKNVSPSPTSYQAKRKLKLQTKAGCSSAGAKQKCNNGNNAKKAGGPISVPKQKVKRGSNAKKGKTVAEKPRYDTSLGQLTKKFIDLLATTTDGIINLNNACEALDVPKRRLYDVTNVLEGAGVIQKTARNNIQFKEEANCVMSHVKKYEVGKEIDDLETKENNLDAFIAIMEKAVTDYKEKSREDLYVTANDLKNIAEFSGEMIIAINIPDNGNQVIEAKGTTLSFTGQNQGIAPVLLLDDGTFKAIKPDRFLYDDTEDEGNNYTVKVMNDLVRHRDGTIAVTAESVKTVQDEIFCGVYQNYDKISGFHTSDSNILSGTMWPECFEDDPNIHTKYVKDFDVDAVGSTDLLQPTWNWQNSDDSLPFPDLNDYSFSLDYSEGLTDLFDCDDKDSECQ